MYSIVGGGNVDTWHDHMYVHQGPVVDAAFSRCTNYNLQLST
jgi:hypothetical protein